ncbi:MAG: hypothetical protein NVSMB19_03020 [Vulcanimicrobiaceae bacterium]
MSLDPAPARSSGLALVWDVIVAPKTAFTALRERTHWGWAYLVTSVLGTLGAVLQIPVGEHIVRATFAHRTATDPQFQGLSPEKLQQALGFALATQHYAWLALPLIVMVAIALTACIFALVNVIGKGGSTFGRLFGLAANVALIGYGIGYLLVGLLAARVGPDAISTQRDLLGLLPSLARLAPENAPKLAALLAGINPFQIWSCVLIVIGLKTMTKLSPPLIYVTAIVVAFGSAAFAALFAR